jgi:predicted nuclease of restriction endonuclease-like RecB superfamily
MPLFKKAITSIAFNSSHRVETREEISQHRAREHIRTLQKHYPRAYEELLNELEQGDYARARLTLRGLADIIDEGYFDSILLELHPK